MSTCPLKERHVLFYNSLHLTESSCPHVHAEIQLYNGYSCKDNLNYYDPGTFAKYWVLVHMATCPLKKWHSFCTQFITQYRVLKSTCPCWTKVSFYLFSHIFKKCQDSCPKIVWLILRLGLMFLELWMKTCNNISTDQKSEELYRA